MGNIINILKYKFKYEYSAIWKLGILLIISIALSSIKVSSVSLGIIGQVILIIMAAIHYIDGLVNSVKFLYKDKGGMLLLAPIKTNEYIISSYLIFAIYLIGFGVLFGIIVLINKLLGVNTLINMSSYVLFALELFSGFIIVQSILVISISVLKNKILKVIGVISGCILIGFVEGFIEFIVNLFPYVYIKVGNYYIDIIKNIFVISYLFIFYIITVKIVDKNLRVN